MEVEQALQNMQAQLNVLLARLGSAEVRLELLKSERQALLQEIARLDKEAGLLKKAQAAAKEATK